MPYMPVILKDQSSRLWDIEQLVSLHKTWLRHSVRPLPCATWGDLCPQQPSLCRTASDLKGRVAFIVYFLVNSLVHYNQYLEKLRCH